MHIFILDANGYPKDWLGTLKDNAVVGEMYLVQAPYSTIPATATTIPTSWKWDTLSPKKSQPPSSTSAAAPKAPPPRFVVEVSIPHSNTCHCTLPCP